MHPETDLYDYVAVRKFFMLFIKEKIHDIKSEKGNLDQHAFAMIPTEKRKTIFLRLERNSNTIITPAQRQQE